MSQLPGTAPQTRPPSSHVVLQASACAQPTHVPHELQYGFWTLLPMGHGAWPSELGAAYSKGRWVADKHKQVSEVRLGTLHGFPGPYLQQQARFQSLFPWLTGCLALLQKQESRFHLEAFARAIPCACCICPPVSSVVCSLPPARLLLGCQSLHREPPLTTLSAPLTFL